MPAALPLAACRTVAVLAAADAGKTTATERMLARADGLEPAAGASVATVAAACLWRGARITLIDVPSYLPSRAEAAIALAAADAALAIVDAARPPEPWLAEALGEAQALGLPVLVFVNKLDRATADWSAALDGIATAVGAPVLPLQLPVAGEAPALLDVVSGSLLAWTGRGGDPAAAGPAPARLRPQLDAARARLVAAAGGLDPASLRAAVAARRFVPALGGSAFEGWGIEALLDALVALPPSPLDAPARVGVLPDRPISLSRAADPAQPAAALVFRVASDPCFGQLAFARVVSGAIAPGDVLLNAAAGVRCQIGRVLRPYARATAEIAAALPGDVVALPGLGGVAAGDTLADLGHPILFPNPLRAAAEPQPRPALSA